MDASKIEILADDPLAIVHLPASVSAKDFLEAMRRLYTDPAWQPGSDVVWDFTAVRELCLEWRDYETFIAFDDAHPVQAGAGRDINAVSRAVDSAALRTYAILSRKGRRPAVVCRTSTELAATLVHVSQASLQRVLATVRLPAQSRD